MPDEIAIAKKTLRTSLRQRLDVLPVHLRDRLSVSACVRLMETPGFKAARSVMLFAPAPDEVNALPLFEAALAAKKIVCLPRMDWAARTMAPVVIDSRSFASEVRQHGIVEPKGGKAASPASLDLVVVPGVAFDASGRRLGRGAGFYDRFLSAYRSSRPAGGAALGLCFDMQVVDRVPAEAHDEPLDGVVTELRLLLCRRQAAPTDRR